VNPVHWIRKYRWRRAIKKEFPKLLRKYARDDSELREYGLKISFTNWRVWNGEGYRRPSPSIYWDCPFGIILYFADNPIACIGFDLACEIVIVDQIQGVRNKENDLRKLRWERFLVRLVTEASRRLGYKEVRISPANKNRWWRIDREQSFKLRYDVTAQREGFKFIKDLNMYALRLS